MASRFSFSRSSDPSPHGHWFRIGTIEVTSSILFVLVSAVFMVGYAFSAAAQAWFALNPDQVLSGFVWQLVTWPFSQLGLSIWTVVALALIWMFGSELERQVGRFRFGGFMLWSTVGLGILAVALSLLLMGRVSAPLLYGPQLLQFVILMVYIAEYPDRRFFFNIPGWVIGLVLLGIQVIGYLGMRNWFALLHLMLGLGMCAVIAKSAGLLQESTLVTKVPQRTAKPKRPRQPKQSRTGTVVAGPWSGSNTREADQAALDDLLDKIHASGMDSLTPKEKKRLMTLRERLRGQ